MEPSIPNLMSSNTGRPCPTGRWRRPSRGCGWRIRPRWTRWRSSSWCRCAAAPWRFSIRHGGWPDAFQTGSEADAASQGTAKVIPFQPRTVEAAPEDHYVTCVPLVPLEAAGGGFSDPQHIEDDDFEWVAVESRHRLRKGMFVAQVVGKSMEPAIGDSAWCLFRAPVEGTRQGKVVLVQLGDATDPETGQRYTVKRYKSEKAQEGDSWRHVKITLKPVNPGFEPIVLTGANEDEFRVIAELVDVLEG